MYHRFNSLACVLLCLFTLFLLIGCAATEHVNVPNLTISPANVTSIRPESVLATGLASYYADKFAWRSTASGEIYNPRAMSAAHRSLPFGTYVRVENMRNHRQVVVRINDRGPFGRGRIIDLSKRAAHELGIIGDGIVEVAISIACPVDGDCAEFVN